MSNNNLSGEIPLTPTLVRFNTSSFSGNVNLCREQIRNITNYFCQSQGPATPPSPPNKTVLSSSKCTKLIKIIGGSVVVLLMMCGKNRTKPEEITSNKALEAVVEIKIKISEFVLIFWVFILWVLKILGA